MERVAKSPPARSSTCAEYAPAPSRPARTFSHVSSRAAPPPASAVQNRLTPGTRDAQSRAARI
ncbi:MAG: hypothetical protein J5985_01175, partial [Kiritimatiellae bacterium]|nr:hypothetical protein [Kiritimatiellia bacterium]